MENELRFNDCFEFYKFIKDTEYFINNEEVLKFVSILDAVPRSCGCVRGALNERAQAQYEASLPMLQVSAAEIFNLIKNDKKVDKISFFSGAEHLLTV